MEQPFPSDWSPRSRPSGSDPGAPGAGRAETEGAPEADSAPAHFDGSGRVDGPGPTPENGRDSADSETSKKRKTKRRDSFLDVSFVVLLALFLALLLKTYVAEAYMIRGHSMEPTFSDSQRVMVQKVFFDIERGDVIIFSSKEDPRKDLIKRVVGLPGDQVQVVDGEVFLNGKKLREDYITPYRYARGEVYGPDVVPADTVFVLGDNRPESQDSRAFDEIRMTSVKGKVILRWWPAAEIRTF